MKKSALLAAATAVATATALGLAGAPTATGAPQAEPAPSPATAVARAKAAISENLGTLRATGADKFLVRDVIVDADGTSHVRMDRTIGGLPVKGGDVVVHQTVQGAWKGASLTLSKSANVDRTPKVSSATAVTKALTKGLKAEGKLLPW